MKNDDADTARFIGWQIARNFLKSLNVHVYDIWLASLCSCSRIQKTDFSWFCSRSVNIFIMVPHLIKEVVNNFSGLQIRQILYRCETFNEAHAISKEKTKRLERDLNIQCHVPGPLAEKLFNNHRKLALVCSSEIKSTNFPTTPTFYNCSCIQLFCYVKGAIPIGEKHFPGELQGIPTDVIEGFPRFSSKHIRIGDSVTNTKMKGTLGGFCRFYGRDAFLTCAHTMIDWDTLRSVELQHHMQQESVHLYTGDNILDPTLLCGRIVNHSFAYDNPRETSTDVALVDICNGFSISEDDYVRATGIGPINYAAFGLKSRYLHNGYIQSLHKLPGQNVQVVCAGAVSGLNSSVGSISTVPRRILEKEDLQSASINLETRFSEIFQAQVTNPVHMQALLPTIIHDSRKEEAESDRTVCFYNQVAVHNIPFEQGDSGACVYITNGFEETGCLGMAIADFPGGGCIVTPMVKLLQKLDLIKSSF
ncbi:uncharacterized protein LOC134727877 [Mytilus trossulus]|uniref:uncharacterized protein LOC134727877 n=1 Tax=Mytilus trossulus TaxID=6551 RepID=UPI0030059383